MQSHAFNDLCCDGVSHFATNNYINLVALHVIYQLELQGS